MFQKLPVSVEDIPDFKPPSGLADKLPAVPKDLGKGLGLGAAFAGAAAAAKGLLPDDFHRPG